MPCRAFAINGGSVCTAHGGSARQVRQAAEVAVLEASLRRGFARDWARWQREWAAWARETILLAWELDGPVRDLDDALCVLAYSEVAPAPRPVLRLDRRFGSRRSAGLVLVEGRWRTPPASAGVGTRGLS